MTSPFATAYVVLLLSQSIILGRLSAQQPERFLGTIPAVVYKIGAGYKAYAFPCKQPVAGLQPALCWVARLAPIEMVDGKRSATEFVSGTLSVSSAKVFFRTDDRRMSTIDFAPNSVTLTHDPGSSYAVLAVAGKSYVIMPTSLCGSCTPKELHQPPASDPGYDTEFKDMTAVLTQFDSVYHRLNVLASQPPASSQTIENKSSPEIAPDLAQVHLLSRVQPVYPAAAKAVHIEGTVVLQATITATGEIASLEVLTGPMILRSAALDAVGAWRYKPFLVNGAASLVRTQINVTFKLSDAAPAMPAQP